jgi:hypothetical protein
VPTWASQRIQGKDRCHMVFWPHGILTLGSKYHENWPRGQNIICKLTLWSIYHWGQNTIWHQYFPWTHWDTQVGPRPHAYFFRYMYLLKFITNFETPGYSVSSTNKTYCQEITEILLKVALGSINPNQYIKKYTEMRETNVNRDNPCEYDLDKSKNHENTNQHKLHKNIRKQTSSNTITSMYL